MQLTTAHRTVDRPPPLDHRGDGRFAWRVQSRRYQCGYSQSQLARVSGVSVRTLQDWEANRHIPYQGDRLMKLAAALRVTHTWLLTGEEES